MTKTLYFLRHAQAGSVPKGGDDIDKPLSPVGRNECLSLAAHMKELNIVPERIFCSAAVRTKETCEYVFPNYDSRSVEYLKELYYTTPNQLLQHIAKIDNVIDTVCIICHNPTVHQISTDLAGVGDPGAYRMLVRQFPPGSFVKLTFDQAEWSAIGAGSGVLESFVTPALLSELMD